MPRKKKATPVKPVTVNDQFRELTDGVEELRNRFEGRRKAASMLLDSINNAWALYISLTGGEGGPMPEVAGVVMQNPKTETQLTAWLPQDPEVIEPIRDGLEQWCLKNLLKAKTELAELKKEGGKSNAPT